MEFNIELLLLMAGVLFIASYLAELTSRLLIDKKNRRYQLGNVYVSMPKSLTRMGYSVKAVLRDTTEPQPIQLIVYHSDITIEEYKAMLENTPENVEAELI